MNIKYQAIYKVENVMNKTITHDLLRSWNPCTNGYKKFCALFPDGATLEIAMAGLDVSGDGFGSKHDDWSFWLFEKCRNEKFEDEILLNGYRNTGYRNTGDRNTGDRNTGDRNTGDLNTGDWNTGDRNTGYRNTGDLNTGDLNTGDLNTGDWNTGDRNTGDRNTGYRNTGYRNTGDLNTGDLNTGNWNTGNWNTGDLNTGYLNTITPTDILLFNKPCERSVFDQYRMPEFMYFDITYWVNESDMTDEDKAVDPNFFVRGGQLRKKDYRLAFIESWEKADKVDRERIREMPNFDADIFYEISGIDLRDNPVK